MITFKQNFYENNQTIKQSNNQSLKLLGILFFLLASCRSEPDFSDEPVDILAEVEVSYKVSQDLAKEIALGFFATDSSYIAGRKIKSSPKIKDIARVALSDTLDFEAFVINELEGFVMISGDSRVMPILAYSSEGELTAKNLQDVNGLKVWYQETMLQIDQELKGIEEVHPIVYNEWKKYTEKYDPNGRIWDNAVAYNPNSNCYEWYQYGQFMCNPYMTVSQRKPLYSYDPSDPLSIGVKWGQSGISNHMAPTNLFHDCGCNDRSPIGCGGVAIAQTLWYFKPGSANAYNLMPQTSNSPCAPATSGQISLALLMYNSALAANTDFNFGTTCNGMTLPGRTSPALKSMGLQNGGNSSNFNPSTLKNELAQGYPAIFYGRDSLLEWHIWTSDGYKTHNYKAYDCDLDGCMEWSYTWYFMNWGWNGSQNGWFSSGVFAPYGSGGSNYNNSLKMITGIR
ncbi:MAG: C10 family peptidase [Algoriphagus sp.]